MGWRVAKAVAFWVALAAALFFAISLALTPDRWWLFSGRPPLAIGHGVLTAIIDLPSNTVDNQRFDYYTPAPVWFALPAVNRGIGNAVLVVPLAPAAACLLVFAWCSWPFQTRRTLSTRAWRAVALCAGCLCTFGGAAFWASGFEGRRMNLRSVGDHPVYIDRGAVAFGTDDFPGLSAATARYVFSTVPIQSVRSGRPPNAPTPQPAWLPQSVPASGGSALLVPLWIPTAALAGVTWLALRQALRRVASGCRHCGYSMTGLSVGAPCPECGTKPCAAAPAR